MRLEEILIQGFKSFAEKTAVKVLPGITCIVGPNGCGKSNVADAIRWALGEQSPKSLRGHRMEDVIFHGSGSRRPVGMAEVTLLFSNDGSLGVPWSEVAVARRLYRTGDSEYLLNRNPCRLRDIHDLFAGTGVNPKAYALMDQERLAHVLTAKPWERRVFIEEAAGIARYKQQRAETRGKLDATRQNLERVRDVMDEVRRQLGSLERQARKAQQYKALHQERQALAVAMAAAAFAGLAAEREAIVRDAARLRAEHDALTTRIAGLDARVATSGAALQDTEHRLGDLRQQAQKLQGEVERLVERREQVGTQLKDLAAEELRLAEELRSIAERRQVVAGEREDKARAAVDARAGVARGHERMGGLEEVLAVRRADLRGHQERLEALRGAQMHAAGERAELTRSAGELRERSLQIERQQARLGAEAEAARGEAARLAAERERLATRLRETTSHLSLLEQERVEVEADLGAREAERAQQSGALSELRLRLASRQSAREALGRLEREREGYGAGVRAVFTADGGALAGVVGTVADLLDVPVGLEAAVEAVLGDRLQWVVVERFDHARAALGYLEREGAGSATFLPLETVPPQESPPDDSPEIRWAARLVGSPRPALLQHLLGGVGLVSHLDAAEHLWRRNGVVATYVTPSGEVLAPTGRLTGGRRDGDRAQLEHSILGRKRAIRQLEDEIDALLGDSETARAALAACEAEIDRQRDRHTLLRSSVQDREATRLAGDKELEALRREEERISRHLDTLAAEEVQLGGERGDTVGRLAELERTVAARAETEASLDLELRALRATVEAGQDAEQALLAELTSCRVELAALSERAEALGRDGERLAELDRDLDARRGQAALRQEQVAARRVELSREREHADARAQDVAAERDRVEGDVARLAETHRDQLEQRQRVEDARRAADAERGSALAELHGLDLRETETRVRGDELLQDARRAHGIDGPEALRALHDPGRDLEAARLRHDELAAKLDAMGPVNLVADEEYQELEQRLEFLRTQHDDLVASIKDLDKALRGMTRSAQERFDEAFQAINDHFSHIFTRLFEGGRAELRPVPPEEGSDDPLDLGVELMAQPRGKRLQSVSLMSGGEKALTGLALLFAIFYYRPSPFCVLDEVDAPLDDANIHRFLRVLRELCTQTQFLVITHNRRTMEAADVLYGVTMEEPGLSRLVSVRLSES